MIASTYLVWGWGGPGGEPDRAALEALAPVVQALLGFGLQAPERPARLRPMPAPRLTVPAPVAAITSEAPLDRARHGLGRAYADLIRGVRGRIDHPPDLVLRPRTEAEVAAVLDWAAQAQVAVVPFGGGTSVVGGVEPAVGDRFVGVVSWIWVPWSGWPRSTRSAGPLGCWLGRPGRSWREPWAARG
jgi:alkyldihydroxyacetonephosphate synthase